MTRYRMDLSYHGGKFSGWASQPGRRTVQGELTEALATVLQAPVALTVAGRTDAGVHALGQVASFDAGDVAPATDLRRALNGLTGSDIAVHGVAPAADGFDARYSARSRTYVYRLDASRAPNPFERGLSLWWPRPLDRDALAECAAALPGRHDFTAFARSDNHHKTFERQIHRAEWRFPESEEGICEFWIEADAFLRGMVRGLVGTMLEVASDRRDPAGFRELLSGASRPEAGDSAQAQGLYLASVSY